MCYNYISDWWSLANSFLQLSLWDLSGIWLSSMHKDWIYVIMCYYYISEWWQQQQWWWHQQCGQQQQPTPAAMVVPTMMKTHLETTIFYIPPDLMLDDQSSGDLDKSKSDNKSTALLTMICIICRLFTWSNMLPVIGTRGGGEICLFTEGKPSFYLSYEQANAMRGEILFAIKNYMGKLNALSGWTSQCEGKRKSLLYENSFLKICCHIRYHSLGQTQAQNSCPISF